MMICFGVAFCLCFVLRFYLVWENKQRDRLGLGSGEITEEERMDTNLADKTDKEIDRFRYVY